MENKRKVYHYLHESASGVVDGEWKNGKFCFTLSEIPYELCIDPRDQRTIVVFDGHIPWGGLPKGDKVVYISTPIRIETNVQSLRKQNLTEEGSRLEFASAAYSGKGTYAYLDICRYALLLPKSVACVRKYDHKSLRPIYTLIEVNEKGVTWRTSSY